MNVIPFPRRRLAVIAWRCGCEDARCGLRRWSHVDQIKGLPHWREYVRGYYETLAAMMREGL